MLLIKFFSIDFTDEVDEPPCIAKRRRIAEPKRWQCNENKQLRMEGKAYHGRKKDEEGNNVTRAPRIIGPRCDSQSCRKRKDRQCNDVDEKERQAIFKHFWSNLDWDTRKEYVRGLVDRRPVKRRTGDGDKSRRRSSLIYHLKLPSDSRKEVCKNMFLSSLGLGEWSVQAWVSDANEKKIDRRVVRPLSEDRMALKKFLADIPKVPSHYCRGSSAKLYLEPIITSMAQLYSIYTDDCKDKGTHALSRCVLHDEFRKMNLSLYAPRKDQCDTCCSYKAGNISQEEWENHRKRKDAARQAKQNDKESYCKEGSKTLVATMDLQALLLCPRLEASALFYKTKLGVHNFTVYNLSDHSVLCYVWHESQGGLTANEFSSCVVDYLSEHDEYDEFILWSDGCSYQNRNAILSGALLNFAVDKRKIVTQKYLERGHTQMEIDSAHSVIERKLKNKEIYCPAEYVSIIKSARKNPSPYDVKYLDYKFFKNYASLGLVSSIRPGSKAGDPTVNEIRCIRYHPDGNVEFKLSHDDAWSVLPIGRRSQRLSKESEKDIPSLYRHPLKVKLQKWKHLQDLKSVIPEDYHSFYDTLPHE